MNITPLSVAGGYWTGSSAVIDLLSEHSQCSVVPYEFTLFSFGQFFKELYHPMMQNNLDLDLDLAEKNLLRFDSFNRSDLHPIRPIIRHVCRKLKVYPSFFFKRHSGLGEILGEDYMVLCEKLSKLIKKQIKSDRQICIEEINITLRLIIDSAVKAMIPDNKPKVKDCKHHIGVFDQFIAPPYEKYSRFAFPELRSINVDRDWRDQYISIRNAYKSMLSVNDSLDIRPWNENNAILKELDPVSYFVELRTSIDKMKQQQHDSKNILWLNFEDLVNNKQYTAMKVFDFLDIEYENWRPNFSFHSEISRRRTKKWLNPKWQSKELDNELQSIALKLSY